MYADTMQLVQLHQREILKKIKVVTNKNNTPTCSQMRVYSEKK